MKKLWILMLSVFLLAGCKAQESVETVGDVLPVETAAPMGQLSITFPEDVSIDVMESEDGVKLYQCEGYQVTQQTMEGGDLDKTLRAVSGYSKDELTLLKTNPQGNLRYDWVFTSAGESGDMMFRCALIDDGAYHYVVTASAPAETAGDLLETWKDLFSSLILVNTD